MPVRILVAIKCTNHERLEFWLVRSHVSPVLFATALPLVTTERHVRQTLDFAACRYGAANACLDQNRARHSRQSSWQLKYRALSLPRAKHGYAAYDIAVVQGAAAILPGADRDRDSARIIIDEPHLCRCRRRALTDCYSVTVADDVRRTGDRPAFCNGGFDFAFPAAENCRTAIDDQLRRLDVAAPACPRIFPLPRG